MKLVLITALFASSTAFAADHAEAPTAAADPAADIADLYAWFDGTDVRFALTFAGLGAPGAAATYDADMLYQIHIDNDGDTMADHSIEVRFGQNDAGEWGVQASGVPGADAPISGPVEVAAGSGGPRVWAGLREDPFFFDLTGFNETLSTGTVAFDSTRDDLAGTNVTAIVIEAARADLDGGTDTINVWATTSRIGG